MKVYWAETLIVVAYSFSSSPSVGFNHLQKTGPISFVLGEVQPAIKAFEGKHYFKAQFQTINWLPFWVESSRVAPYAWGLKKCQEVVCSLYHIPHCWVEGETAGQHWSIAVHVSLNVEGENSKAQQEPLRNRKNY